VFDQFQEDRSYIDRVMREMMELLPFAITFPPSWSSL